MTAKETIRHAIAGRGPVSKTGIMNWALLQSDYKQEELEKTLSEMLASGEVEFYDECEDAFMLKGVK